MAHVDLSKLTDSQIDPWESIDVNERQVVSPTSLVPIDFGGDSPKARRIVQPEDRERIACAALARARARAVAGIVRTPEISTMKRWPRLSQKDSLKIASLPASEWPPSLLSALDGSPPSTAISLVQSERAPTPTHAIELGSPSLPAASPSSSTASPAASPSPSPASPAASPSPTASPAASLSPPAPAPAAQRASTDLAPQLAEAEAKLVEAQAKLLATEQKLLARELLDDRSRELDDRARMLAGVVHFKGWEAAPHVDASKDDTGTGDSASGASFLALGRAMAKGVASGVAELMWGVEGAKDELGRAGDTFADGVDAVFGGRRARMRQAAVTSILSRASRRIRNAPCALAFALWIDRAQARARALRRLRRLGMRFDRLHLESLYMRWAAFDRAKLALLQRVRYTRRQRQRRMLLLSWAALAREKRSRPQVEMAKRFAARLQALCGTVLARRHLARSWTLWVAMREAQAYEQQVLY